MAHENAGAQSQPTRLIFAKGTDVGRKRGHNEDYVDAFRPSDPDKRRQKGELFIVADGMGGHQAGEVASENAVETASREYYASPVGDVSDALSDAIEKANSVIYRLAQESPARAGMGTTAVAAVVRGRELYVANVGDSRAYLLRNGKLTQVTRDHSFVQEQIEAGILTPEEARTHPQRNVVTRALGSKPDVQVDTFGGKLEPGDTLLLCTDGLSEHVEDETIAAMLSQYHPREAVPRLIALANQRGGSDNISALVVQIGSAAGTTAVAGAVPAGQAVPAAPSRPTGAREGLSLPLIAGLSAGGLILVAALVVGLVFFGPRFLWGDAEETSQPPAQSIIATATLLSPSPTEPPATATLRSSSQSLTPESTSAGSAGAPTSTPRVGLTLLEPDDRAIVPPDARVPFRWEVSGTLPDPFNFVVKTHQSGYEELCGGSSMSCGFRLAVGEYQWWVELWSGNTMMLRSEARTLSVRPPTPTPSPTSTFTPVPPTNTPRPPGGGGGGNGGDTTKPTKTPSVPSAMPTDTKETPEPPGGGG